jgi:hypothetical protein
MNNLNIHGGACRVQPQAPAAPHDGSMQVNGTTLACLMIDRF